MDTSTFIAKARSAQKISTCPNLSAFLRLKLQPAGPLAAATVFGCLAPSEEALLSQD